MPPPDNPLTPIVLQPLSLPNFLHRVLSQARAVTSRSTLLICTDRTTFLHQLLHTFQQTAPEETIDLEHLVAPTLHNLFSSQRITLAFCASIQSLLAYLSAYKGPVSGSQTHEDKTMLFELILVNPLLLHATTLSFSAQGLSRTFAAAVEAAQKAKMRLVVAECVGMRSGNRQPSVDLEGETVDTEVENTAGPEEELESEGIIQEDLWEREVPILNVSARRFGLGGGERGWAGRTVKVKRVVEQWCQFEASSTSIEG